MAEWPHNPVMVAEVLRYLALPRGGCVIDGTVGFGGHAQALLEAVPEARVLGIDRDLEAIEGAGQRLAGFGARVQLERGRFSRMAEFAAAAGWGAVDGVLLDLGVSSAQIDRAQRGFSHRYDGPLDMRMDGRAKVTAASLLNHLPENELADLFHTFGEERRSRRVARAVVRQRLEKPFERTSEFAALLDHCIGRQAGGLPSATRCFQALRIAVNDELTELSLGLEAAHALLRPGGRLVVISFHSLEDRQVKTFFREQAATCTCPHDFPVCVCHRVPTLEILTRKPVRAGPEELRANRRATPAKLRAAARPPADEGKMMP